MQVRSPGAPRLIEYARRMTEHALHRTTPPQRARAHVPIPDHIARGARSKLETLDVITQFLFCALGLRNVFDDTDHFPHHSARVMSGRDRTAHPYRRAVAVQIAHLRD